MYIWLKDNWNVLLTLASVTFHYQMYIWLKDNTFIERVSVHINKVVDVLIVTWLLDDIQLVISCTEFHDNELFWQTTIRSLQDEH